MSVMDKAALCREISERLEPLEVGALPDFRHDIDSGLWKMRGDSWHWDSIAGFWWRQCHDSETHSVDFFNDESASARLLEAMRYPLLVSDWPGCEGWRVDMGVEYSQGPLKGPTHKDRKTAIALAAKRWLHIEGELEP